MGHLAVMPDSTGPCIKNAHRCQPTSQTIAVFDFDGTITSRDSLLPFVLLAVGLPRFVWGLIRLSPILLGYALRIVRNSDAKEAMFRFYFGGMAPEKLDDLARTFARERLPRLIRPEAMRRLRWHQEQGHVVAVASASIEAYLVPWTQSVGLTHVVGTRLEVVAGRLTGRFTGRNCYGPEKVARLEELFGTLEHHRLYAYGDSKGDRALLEVADHAFYRRFEEEAPERSDPLPVDWERRFIWAAVIAAVVYAGAVWWSGAGEFFAAVRSLPSWVIVASLCVVFMGFAVRFCRWHWYIVRMGHAVPLGSSFRIYIASLALSISPGRAGESVKALLLKRQHDVPISHTIAGVLCERFTDLLAVLLIVSLGIVTAMNAKWAIVTFAALQICVVLLLQRADLVRKWVLRPMRRWPVLHFLADLFDSLLDRTSLLLGPGILIGGVSLAIVSWVSEGIALYWLFQYLGAESITAFQATMIMAASDLVGAISFLPGGIGGAEVTLVSLSMVYGASQTAAVAATFLIRLMTLWFGVCLGIVAMAREQQIRRA